MWPDRRIQDLFGIELPIIQAPMAGSVGSEMAVAVSEAGGLGSLPCAMLNPEQMRNELGVIRQRTSRPINLNFFCHQPPQADPARENAWKQRLEGFYVELGLDPQAPVPAAARAPFDHTMCDLVEEFRPEVVSFHFGLPERSLLERVRATGAKIVSSATTVDEARWLESQGCDAIIAQGYEAGGHRGIFLSNDISTQAGTMALVPQVVDAVKVPVIAAGGIADGRSVVAAFALGASAVQIGTAYLFCPEAKISLLHRDALRERRTTTRFSRTYSRVGPPVELSIVSCVRSAQCRISRRSFRSPLVQWLQSDQKPKQVDQVISRRFGQVKLLPSGEKFRLVNSRSNLV